MTVVSGVFYAPAKLNLFLHVVGRRADGLHELQTVFQLLDYCDTLTFSVNNTGEIYREDSAERYDNDLILRAAKKLQSFSQTKQGAKISLDKKIPLGGGLGGGSSDAATTLVALNKLWQLDLPTETLAEIGLGLGADVPVFVHGFSAWAEGVGEKLTPCETPKGWFLVVNPKVHVSTSEIFCAKELTRDSTRIKICALSDVMLDKQTRNDCLGVVTTLYPEVAKALDWLSAFAPAKLTGTGACVFAKFASKTDADAALLQLPKKWQGFVAEGKNRSPLYVTI